MFLVRQLTIYKLTMEQLEAIKPFDFKRDKPTYYQTSILAAARHYNISETNLTNFVIVSMGERTYTKLKNKIGIIFIAMLIVYNYETQQQNQQVQHCLPCTLF